MTVPHATACDVIRNLLEQQSKPLTRTARSPQMPPALSDTSPPVLEEVQHLNLCRPHFFAASILQYKVIF
jgi:hypothetical protein